MSVITQTTVAKHPEHIARIGMGHARRASKNAMTTICTNAPMAHAMLTIAVACTAVNGARPIPVRPGSQSAMSTTGIARTVPIHKTNAV